MNLTSLKTKHDLMRVIVEELGYPAVEEQLFPLQIDEKIKLRVASANIIAAHKGFSVVFVQFNSNKDEYRDKFDLRMRGLERMIISKIDKHLRQQHLFIFTSSDGEYWHFVSARSSGSRLELRRFSITPFNRSRLRTISDRLALTRVESDDNLQSLIEKHRKAFDVEEVTMEFFRIFADKFLELIELMKSCRMYLGDQKKISDTAQIILNRLIFLKFIEQKRWLDNSSDYLYEKFQPYFSKVGSYWHEIVTSLFELLSDKDRKKYKELGDIPFLNGGLFGKEPKDLFLIPIPNSFFQDLFENLLNRFNFTIEESSPSSIEVAVDPEMLGRIFEELVLRLEKAIDKPEAEFKHELRRETGSYYTPRVAVYFMSREAIAHRIADISGVDVKKTKKLIDLSTDEYEDVDQLAEIELSKTECQSILRTTENISICDPAVGSGAFLLGSLQILVGVKRFLMLKTGDARTQDPNFNYTLKEQSIRHNLIGVDILRQAVHICELRLWLSLVVDYQHQSGDKIPTLPNLTYKVFQGDSIVDHLAGEALQSNEGRFRLDNFSANESIRQKLNKIKALKDGYFNETDEERKKKLEKQIIEERMKLAIEILECEAPPKLTQADMFDNGMTKPNPKKVMEKNESDSKHELITRLKRLLASKNFTTPLALDDKLSFVWLIDLVEYFIDHGQTGFDIIIGNPPYGVKNEVMGKGKVRYELGSQDSYGIFIAMAFQDLLKTGGVLSFITSDTWQTIKTHKSLRRFLLDNSLVHYLLMMPSWLFGATVNTSILIATKTTKGRPTLEIQGGRIIFENSADREQNELVTCDFTRAGENTGELEEYLYSLDNPEYISTPKKACYHYKQGLIESNSNWPFFVGSPKLFALMNDTTCKTIEKEIGDREKKKVKVRQIELNGKIVELVRFGDVADVRVGLQTGDNKFYLFQNPDARGSYKNINDYLEFLLTTEDLKKISSDEKLRMKIIEKGIHKSKTEGSFDSDLWFGGRYIASYDKGGESDVESGFLPNYYVPTNYFIDWSCDSVKKLSTAEAARFQNVEFYFREGLTLSYTGQYAPNLKINSAGVFDVGGSSVFPLIEKYQILGNFACKITKYIGKNWIDHTVNFQVDENKELPILIMSVNKINSLVKDIIEKQKEDLRYDYMSNEQKEIDKLVYEMYGLNADDIREVETWYARRYPKLARFCDLN